jgi:hypothetical protein
MLGLEDRVAIRDRRPINRQQIAGQEGRQKDDKAKPDGKPSDAKSAAKPDAVNRMARRRIRIVARRCR